MSEVQKSISSSFSFQTFIVNLNGCVLEKHKTADWPKFKRHKCYDFRFKGTKLLNVRIEATDEYCERCAAFMPLQCGICEGIRIVPMLLDVTTLRRDESRVPVDVSEARSNVKGARHSCRFSVVFAKAFELFRCTWMCRR